MATAANAVGSTGGVKRVFEKGVVGPSPSEKTQGAKAEAGDAPACIVDAGRQSHRALQPGEARATSTPSAGSISTPTHPKLLDPM